MKSPTSRATFCACGPRRRSVHVMTAGSLGTAKRQARAGPPFPPPVCGAAGAGVDGRVMALATQPCRVQGRFDVLARAAAGVGTVLDDELVQCLQVEHTPL